MSTGPTVDDLAQLSLKLACDEVEEIMAGEDHIVMNDLTASEMIRIANHHSVGVGAQAGRAAESGAGSKVGALRHAPGALGSGWIEVRHTSVHYRSGGDTWRDLDTGRAQASTWVSTRRTDRHAPTVYVDTGHHCGSFRCCRSLYPLRRPFTPN